MGAYAHCAVRVGHKIMLKVWKIIFSVFEDTRIDLIDGGYTCPMVIAAALGCPTTEGITWMTCQVIYSQTCRYFNAWQCHRHPPGISISGTRNLWVAPAGTLLPTDDPHPTTYR